MTVSSNIPKLLQLPAQELYHGMHSTSQQRKDSLRPAERIETSQVLSSHGLYTDCHAQGEPKMQTLLRKNKKGPIPLHLVYSI